MANADGSLRIRTAGRGMVRLTYDELLAAGVPLTDPTPPDPATFALWYLGDAVAAEVTGDGDATFEPGELVIFYAQPYTGRYQTDNVYWFTWGGDAGLRMDPAGDAACATAGRRTTTPDHDHRPDAARRAQPGVPQRLPAAAGRGPLVRPAPDRGHRDQLLTKARAYDLALDDDALTTGDLRLTVTLHGAAAQTPNPDKSVELKLNSHVVGPYQWDGLTYNTITAVLPASDLAPSGNQLTLTAALAQLPGISFYTVSPDWAELTYPATADVLDGGVRTDSLYIEGLAAAGDGGDPNQVAVTGFSTAEVAVYDLRVPNEPVRLLTTDAVADGGGGYTLNFWDEDTPGATYFLTTADKLAAPAAIEPPALDSTPSPLRVGTNQADYIAIVYHDPLDGPHDLWGAIDTLLAHRAPPAGGNFRFAKVDVQQIYDEFSYGRRDPEAIRTFLAYAYTTGRGRTGPPRPRATCCWWGTATTTSPASAAPPCPT